MKTFIQKSIQVAVIAGYVGYTVFILLTVGL